MSRADLVVRRPQRHRTRHCTVAVAVVVLAAACSPAPAAPPAPPPVGSLPAVGIAARLGASEVPDVVGLAGQAAGAALQEHDLEAQLVAFDDSDVVSGQYPAAGSAAPLDGVVTVWLGEPAVPPPPSTLFGDGPQHATAPAAAAPPRQPAPATSGTPTAQVRETTPESAGAPPTGSIRTRPPVAGGTVLAGPASWYGPGFAGRTTACGDRFDPRQHTLATRELPCGTRVVVRTRSGGAVEAVVTDWGPAAWTGRRFDLSRATFGALAPLGAGVIDVAVEVR